MEPKHQIEPQPCEKCGQAHEPGVCPEVVTKEKAVERVLSPEEKAEQEASQEWLVKKLSYDLDISATLKSIDELKYIKDFSSLISKPCQKGLENQLTRDGFLPAQEIIDFAKKHDIELDVATACQKGLEALLSRNSFISNQISPRQILPAQKIIDFAEKNDIKLDIASASQKTLESFLSEGDISRAEGVINFAEKKNISLDLAKPDLASALQKGFEYRLSQFNISRAEEIINFAEKKNIPFSLDFSKPEIASAFQERLESCLSEGYISGAEEIINFAEKKNIHLELAPAFQKGLEEGLSREIMSHLPSRGPTYFAQEIINFAEKKNFSLDLAPAFQKRLELLLSQGGIFFAEEIINFAEKKNISLDLAKPDLASALQKGFEYRLSQFNISRAEEIINFVEKKNIPLDLAPACQEALESLLSQGGIFFAEEIINFAEKKNISLDLAKPDLASALQKGFEYRLSQGDIPRAEEIINFVEKKNIPLDLASACQKGLESCLSRGNISSAQEINNTFLHLSAAQVFENFSSLLHDLFSVLEKSAPRLIEQSKKSIDLFFSLFQFRENPERLFAAIKENPFLADALEGNARFGARLLIKYPEFDETSTEKIKTLFEAKQEIIKQNPEIDPQSLEFREAMQEKLRAFGRNAEILEAMDDARLKTEAFLNYSETQYFTLKEGAEAVSLSEKIQTPINRIAETLSSYAYQVKEALSAYRDDMIAIEVLPKSAEEAEARIANLEQEIEKARADGNEKKAQGMEKGLAGLRVKLEQTKKVPLWNRLTDEIAGFTKLKDGLIEGQNALVEKEKNYHELLSSKSPSGVELAKLKSQIGQAKEEFKNRLSQLERRVNDFRENLVPVLEPLGRERAESLVQEANERVAEEFNHFETDRATLADLFTEKGDREKESLEDRKMSIFVWARNPDIDLYQGNYSSCCICIDSKYHGAESPIADYAADLGIQVVNIWDEAKGEPVTAAWVWLGLDEEGKTALVVDNIEANTQYSTNFPQKLTQELFQYLKDYAKAINADRLVLGEDNNDLPTRVEEKKLPEAETQFTKIGGTTGRPDGYYLEAEETSVKLLWEKGAKMTAEKKEHKKEKKIALKDLSPRGLSEEDYSRVVKLEAEVYEEEDLARGHEMIREMQNAAGEKYSVALFGRRPKDKRENLLGYTVVYESETNEGEPCVYLDDIAVAPDLKGQGLGWQLFKETIFRLKEEAARRGKPVYFNMDLRPDSRDMIDRHEKELPGLGLTPVESALRPDYYDEGEDALYRVFEVRA